MNNWQYHDKKMLELKKCYNRISKQTQNRLQEIINSFNINYKHLYNIADNKTKNKVNTYIEEWQDKGILTGYFGMLAKNIYKRTRVKNSEILQLFIYGAYMEEQNKLDKYEKQIMYDDANYYYQQGQIEVNKAIKEKKQISALDMALFLYLLEQPNAKGYVWKQYIEAITKYNAEQIYRQVTIDLQQQNEIDITNDIYQNIIRRQGNSRLNIKEGIAKSGDVDLTLIGINNLTKIEGIKQLDKNAKVQFISDQCEHVTMMCSNMDRMTFNINDWNEFDRWYGESAKDLRIERIKARGLICGINLPPITHHFHYCHSYIMYLPNEEIAVDKKYNIFSSKIEKEIEKRYNINKARIKGIDVKALNSILNNMEQVYKDFPQIKEKIKEIQSIEHPNGGLNIEPDLKDNNFIIQINKKFFKDEKIVQEQYEKDVKIGFHPKGTTYKDMGIHELGHSITFEIIKNKYKGKNQIANDWNKNITAKEIVSNAFKNLQINDKLTQDILRNNISNYSISSYGETIGEAFADYYANKEHSNILSKEIVKTMKGMI